MMMLMGHECERGTAGGVSVGRGGGKERILRRKRIEILCKYNT
jgi:hypothetical protein